MLTISEPGDTYEQEADEVAERVMRTRTPSVSKARKAAKRITFNIAPPDNS